MKADLTRRIFLKRLLMTALAAGAAPVPRALAAYAPKTVYNTVPTRLLGKTEEHVSMLGLNAAQLAHLMAAEARTLIRKARDVAGKTVIDLVWDDGRAAEMVAAELSGDKREKLFLVTGTGGHSKTACLKELSETLYRLDTDRVDLWVIKESVYEADPSYVFSKDGAIGAAIHARENHMIKHIGVAGYRNPDFFMAAMEGFFDFRVAEIPMNGIGPYYRKFQEKVLPRLRARNIGTIVSDPIAGSLDKPRPLPPDQILGLLWSQLISVVAAGADSPETFDRYIDMAKHYHTIPEALRPRLLGRLEKM